MGPAKQVCALHSGFPPLTFVCSYKPLTSSLGQNGTTVLHVLPFSLVNRFKKSDGPWSTDLLSPILAPLVLMRATATIQTINHPRTLDLGAEGRKTTQVTDKCATSFLCAGERKRSLGRDYHPLCLKCQKCSRQLTAGQHAEVKKERKMTRK